MRKICFCIKIPHNLGLYLMAFIVLITTIGYFIQTVVSKAISDISVGTLGIMISVFIFLMGVIENDNIRLRNQKEILKNLLVEIHFLTKKTLKFEDGESYGGHLDYFNKCLERKDGWPHHNMRNLTPLLELDASIDKKPTSSIKHLVFHANDKIKLLNYYRVGKLRKEKDKIYIWDHLKQTDKEYIPKIIKELENILRNIQTKIERDFEIRLKDEEIRDIEESAKVRS